MYIHDSHVHTKYSFDGPRDGSGEVSAVIEAAIARGVDELSLTDHCDIDDILDGIYPPFDAAEVKRDILETREKYKGKIRVNYGVELGQAHARKKEALALLDTYGYDFVIGSVHNLRAYPDFSMIRFEHCPDEMIAYLMRRNLDELLELAEFGRFSTIGHITYIQRYLTLAGREFDYRPYRDRYEKLFSSLISSGTALEINTSGLRRNSITMPGRELLELYHEMGGERITLGSDAHFGKDIGAGIEEAAAMLRDIGFRSQTVVRDGKLAQIEL